MSCPVTLDNYTNDNYPVAIPCGHTISVAAAKQIIDRSYSHNNLINFSCPICRKVFQIQSVNDLPKNFGLLEHIENTSNTQSIISLPPLAPSITIEENQTNYDQQTQDNSPYRIESKPTQHGHLAKISLKEELIQDMHIDDPRQIFIGCDVSGSMGSLVNEELGLTRLDLVKYNVDMLLIYLAQKAEKTIHNVTIVAFSDRTRVIADKEEVTIDTLPSLRERVNSMKPTYTTNILGAINKLISLMIPEKNNIAVILTDGQPTDNEGIVKPDNPESYVNILKNNAQFNSFSIIGYGHNLSHRIMIETARAGGGVCSFGSDESMISNVFIRWLGWAFTTYPHKCALIRSEILNNQSCNEMTHIVPALTRIFPQYILLKKNRRISHLNGFPIINDSDNLDLYLEDHDPHLDRLRFCKVLEESIIIRSIRPLIKLINTNNFRSRNTELSKECFYNANNFGQIGMAFEPQYFNKWGQAYLYSTLRGHEMMHQWNFKDKILNNYRTYAFDEEVRELDDIFATMPPPIPTYNSSKEITARSMATIFNNKNSTCWVKNSVITLADGSDCLIQNVRPGMRVASYSIETRSITQATVEWVTREPVKSGIVKAVMLGERGLAQLTPNHPVIDFSVSPSPCYKWPSNLGDVVDCETNYVYNLVLNRNHHVISDGVICVTLGHGITEKVLAQNGFMGRNVVPHSFFGDRNLILEQLTRINELEKSNKRKLGHHLETEKGREFLKQTNMIKYLFNDSLPQRCILINQDMVKRDDNGFVVSWI